MTKVMSVLATGVKTSITAGLASAASRSMVSIVASLLNGYNLTQMKTNVKKAAVDGFCDGFMWGGLGFGFTRTVGAITFKTQIFNRKFEYGENNFMFGNRDLTLWRHGKDFRIEMGAEYGLHYHLRGASGGISTHHTELVRGIYYCLIGIKNAINAIFP